MWYGVPRLFAPAPAPRSAAATVHRDKTSRCFVYAAMTRPVLPSRIGVQTRQTVYTRTHDCHSVGFVVCLAKRRAPSVCCMCAAPVHANTAKQCKGANVRETPDSKILQTQSIHHTDKAKCLSVAPLLSEHHQRFLLQLLTLGGASRAWEQSTTLKCSFACHHRVSSLAHTQTVFTSASVLFPNGVRHTAQGKHHLQTGPAKSAQSPAQPIHQGSGSNVRSTCFLLSSSTLLKLDPRQ